MHARTPKLSPLYRHAAQRLEGWINHTRLFIWPEQTGRRFDLFGLHADPDHITLTLDAIDSFFPGSEVVVWTLTNGRPPRGDNAVESYPNLLDIRFKALESWNTRVRSNVLMLLHPWPWIDEERRDELRCVRRVFSRARAGRKWILFRNMELWRGDWPSRIRRGALRPLLNIVSERIGRHEDEILGRRVLPRLPTALAWDGAEPCSHPHAERLFDQPRPIDFCPDCAMGITPDDETAMSELSDTLYGQGYARSYRLTGDREWRRYARESRRRVEGYLAALGFPRSFTRENGRALDYGCGNGRFIKLWTGRGLDCVAVDPSKANILHARRFGASRDSAPGVGAARIEVGDLTSRLVTESAPFHVISVIHVLEHVADPEKLLADLWTLAKSEGYLYVEVPNAQEYTWSARHRGFANPEHRWDFTPSTLRALLRASGWRDARTTLDPSPDEFPFLAAAARKFV